MSVCVCVKHAACLPLFFVFFFYPRPPATCNILLLFFDINLVSFLFSNHERRMLRSAELTYVAYIIPFILQCLDISCFFFTALGASHICIWFHLRSAIKKIKRRALIPYATKSNQLYTGNMVAIIIYLVSPRVLFAPIFDVYVYIIHVELTSNICIDVYGFSFISNEFVFGGRKTAAGLYYYHHFFFSFYFSDRLL